MRRLPWTILLLLMAPIPAFAGQTCLNLIPRPRVLKLAGAVSARRRSVPLDVYSFVDSGFIDRKVMTHGDGPVSRHFSCGYTFKPHRDA